MGCRWTRHGLKELKSKNAKLKRVISEPSLEKLILEDIVARKLYALERRRSATEHAQGLGERRARPAGEPATCTQRYRPIRCEDEGGSDACSDRSGESLWTVWLLPNRALL